MLKWRVSGLGCCLTWSKMLVAIHAPTDSVLDVTFSPGGKQVISASCDNTVRVWSSMNGESIHILKSHTAAVMNIRYSMEGRELLSSSI